MSVIRTLVDEPERSVDKVRLLTYVLGYDDLLAGKSAHFRLDELTRPITIGRADDDPRLRAEPPSLLRIPDRWMSGAHASLDSLGDDDVLRDEGSRNGTYVNGRRITEHRLSDGDLIEVGEKGKQMALLLEAIKSAERDVPDYIEADHNKMTAKLLRVPGLSEVPFPVQMEPNLVVEFYSR